MDLNPFIKKPVSPGEPLTAQAWNDLLDGVDGAYQFLLSSMHTVRVTITSPGLDPESVRVTASRSTGAPVEAVRPIPPSTDHLLSRLDSGAWTITAEAAGYQTATAAVTIADAGETAVQMAMIAAGAFMPDLFSASLSTARAALAQAGVPLLHLFDFNGRELPPTNAGDGTDDDLVLVQWPAPGVAMTPGTGARLVIAVPLPVEQAVSVPPLTSLSQQEAQKALEAVGLVLGKVTQVSK